MPSTTGPQAALVDTNILLRIAQFDSTFDELLLASIGKFRERGVLLCLTFQNLAEFWNVATRPEQHRGFGRTLKQVANEVDRLTSQFMLLPESPGAFSHWRRLVEDFRVTGVLVHDTRLAAIMLEYGITDILTLNAKDFARFPFLTPIDPREAD